MALATLLLLHAAPASAFRLLRVDGNPCGSAKSLFWPPAAASLSAGLLSSSDANLLFQGSDAWNGSVQRFRFRSGSGDHCSQDDGAVGIAFDTVDCNGRNLGSVLGVTISRFFTDTGELVDANITFNSNAPALNDDAIYRQAAMHELGHVLGLDHSDTCGASGTGTLMKSVIVLSDPRITAPQADDIQGANTIYPGSGGNPSGDGSTATNSCAIGDRGGTGAALSLAVALAALLLRRRTA